MAADGRPGDVNPVGWWWMGIVGRWIGCGLFPDELVEVVRHKVVVPVGGSIEVLGVGAGYVGDADVGSLTSEVLRVGDSTDCFVERRTTVARVDDDGFIEMLAQWFKHDGA